MVIGNNMSNAISINGQFEEMETFNYQLSPSAILSNFQVVSNVDSDLDGVPDYLEDIKLTTNRPFLGAPVVITGTIEAEQFDMGGPGVGYSNVVGITNSTYRPTGMVISACNDLGGGYCLDQMQSNDWAKYTINVLVPQTYMIETRVAGIGTNGAFEIKFTTNGTSYTNTGPLVITTTNWTDVTNVVYLEGGINVMTLLMLTNANTGTNVGRFNYISIYPWWPSPTVGPGDTAVSLSTNTNYASALSNATNLQGAINALGSAGGTVTITNATGTFMVAQASPNESNDAYANAAVNITNSNVKIVGQGESNTVLVGYNRATTVFCLGVDAHTNFTQCSDFTLCNMTLEAQPHEEVSGGSGEDVVTNAGQLFPVGEENTGALTILYGQSTQFAHNVLFTNCQFLSADRSIVMPNYVSNVMVRACNFVPCGGVDTWGYTNVYTGQPVTYEVSIQIRDGESYNIAVLENTYNGNSLISTTNTNTAAPVIANDLVSATNGWAAADGLVYFQQAGNVFIARNFITNNRFEAIQLNAGPASVVGNTFYTLINDGSCCALNGTTYSLGLPGTNSVMNSTTFIGNWVYGDRCGDLLIGNTTNGQLYATVNVSGNWLNLSPVFDIQGDFPGAVAALQFCQNASVFGNTEVTGGFGVAFQLNCGNALVLNNNFGTASYCGIGYQLSGDSLNSAQIFSNILGQGVNFHAQLPYTNSFSWFMGTNTYLNINSNNVPVFTDPASTAIHIFN
jgi:hypothetical protein